MQKSTGRPRSGIAARLLVVLVVGLSLSGCVPPPPPGPGTGPTFDILGTSAMSADRSVALRDLYVADPGPGGYQPGSTAPLAMQVWNNTNEPVSLTSASASGAVPMFLVGGGGGGAEAASSSPPTSATFDVPVQPSGNVPLDQASGRYLQIGCVSTILMAGNAVEVTFSFSNGATITANVPVGAQLPPVPAAPVPLAAEGC